MIRFLGLILNLLLLSFKIYPQNTDVAGKIIDKQTTLPVIDANILFYKDNICIYHTISDSIGNFKTSLSFLSQSTHIKISSINYDDFIIDQKTITHVKESKNFNLGVLKMRLKNIQLKEIKVKSNRRYRDTTKLDLSKKKFERSVMIDDLFSHYGFSKDASGQLYYKGKPITDIKINGGDFFGKNNTDIYHLLPALVLQDIDIIETNIDSTTNTTLLRPSIKINLKLKDKYNKGKFGNASLAAGTANRYIGNSNLYVYRNKEQLSLMINANNINNNDNFILDPKVNFSASGNNLTDKSSELTYRNVFANKIEVNLSVKGKIEEGKFVSESEIQQENINTFSKIFTADNSKTFEINNTKLSINYQIDSLSIISASQSFEHSNIKGIDSSNYITKTDSLNTTSQLNKLRSTSTNLYNTQINYQKKFLSKKGRSLNLGMELNSTISGVNELDNVNNLSNQKLNKYFINGARSAKENRYSVRADFTEPLDEDSYINFFLNYEKNNLNYKTQTNSDTTITNIDVPSISTNQYFRPGVKFQKTFNKLSINANVGGMFDLRNVKQLQNNETAKFFNLNAGLKADYKINTKKSLSMDYSDVTSYPNIQQLTSLNSTFDLISQNTGNINLKPEQKNSIKITYNTRPSDSENISITGEFDHFDQKIGLSVDNLDNINAGYVIENTSEVNVGNSNGGEILFSLLKNIYQDKYLSFNSNISYQESPTIINNKLVFNNGIAFNQSISTSLAIIKSLFLINPIIATSYNKYFYETTSFNISTLTYSDKLSLTLKTLQINLYPLINYNHSINNNSSFSMNGEIKKSIFKDYGSIWFQAYDIFNSFKYINNYVGPNSYQSVKYSNLNRYVLLGLSLKFNNMK